MAPRAKRKSILSEPLPAVARIKRKKKRDSETPEQRQQRLQRIREYQQKKIQNETLLEREERLARARWRNALQKKKVETQEARLKRLESKRLEKALRLSQMKEELAKQQKSTETGKTYHSVLKKIPHDQLHQTCPKVVRLSASNVKHLDIAPKYPNTYRIMPPLHYPPPLNYPPPLHYPGPMDDGFDSYNHSALEPKVIVSELDYPVSIPVRPVNDEPMTSECSSQLDRSISLPLTVVKVKAEPLESEYEPLTVGDSDMSNPEYITGDIDIKAEPIVSEADNCEVRMKDLKSGPELMISETTDSTNDKSEMSIKSEVFVEEL